MPLIIVGMLSHEVLNTNYLFLVFEVPILVY